MPVIIYHNPRCSKSRQTLALIRDSGTSVTVIPYLDDPPSAERILEIASLLGEPVLCLLRQKEAEVSSAADLPDLADDAALAAWISAHPRALERPVVVDDANRRTAIGRPPENVGRVLRR